ncbi:hypothetical protein MSAN_02390900 [Mycena sanguinolenta]|uniref:Uncharacterized protein n=1 Tax=Mycena sanguinolenta TaxID=230812 RepID=A0A8H6X4G5_9AGAR|nr:hypothetical protein MSAN_02390900 [Mycena sanguinolenta]
MGRCGWAASQHSLTLPSLRENDLPIVCGALQKIGDELHHLDLTVRCTPEPGDQILETIDLSLHPNLQTLRIHDTSWIDAQQTIWQLPMFITKLAAPGFEHITLEFDFSQPLNEELD